MNYGKFLLTNACCLAALSASAKEVAQPNVIFILVDDLGFSDLNFLGQKDLRTPNIDRLASEGVYFSNAYAPCPVSSPSRAAFLTGESPAKLHLTCHIPGVGMDKYVTNMAKGRTMGEALFVDRLPADQRTIGHLMQDAGYKTAFMGKWHLSGEGSVNTKDGIVDKSLQPDSYGFDINIGGCAYGQPASYFSPYRNATIEDGADGEYLTDRLGDEAAAYIAENKKNPFFLYLSFYAVHTPYQVPDDVTAANGGNKYYALIEKMDQNVGKVLDALKKQKLEKNTLVIFYSDNGGLLENPPLSGIKGDLLEGGIRVPAIVKWDGVVAKGTTCDEPITGVDLYPTLAELVGVATNPDNIDESRSILPIIKGESESVADRALYWHFPHHRAKTTWAMGAAMRDGDWKIIELYESNEIRLFNLKDDPAEQRDLSESNPAKAFEMLNKLHVWQRGVGAAMPRPTSVAANNSILSSEILNINAK